MWELFVSCEKLPEINIIPHISYIKLILLWKKKESHHVTAPEHFISYLSTILSSNHIGNIQTSIFSAKQRTTYLRYGNVYSIFSEQLCLFSYGYLYLPIYYFPTMPSPFRLFRNGSCLISIRSIHASMSPRTRINTSRTLQSGKYVRPRSTEDQRWKHKWLVSSLLHRLYQSLFGAKEYDNDLEYYWPVPDKIVLKLPCMSQAIS